jgi:glycosyltransferase involved in cell wall biosynthesis
MLFAERSLAKITDTIICDSNDVANFMIYKQSINSKKIMVILNGIDVEKFQRNIDTTNKKAELQIGEDEMVVGSVGRLVQVKDYPTLLKAFAIITNKINKCKLVILGDGILRAELEAYVNENGLSKKVMFLGSRRDIPEMMQIFDVFVLSSVSEGLPIALLEAMAAGIPVVATMVGGIPEVVVDGGTGLLVPPQNPAVLAEAISSVLLDKEKARYMGTSGRHRVVESFNLSNTSQSYEQVYDETINTAKLIGL